MGLALQAGATHKKEEGDLEGSALYRKEEEEWPGLAASHRANFMTLSLSIHPRTHQTIRADLRHPCRVQALSFASTLLIVTWLRSTRRLRPDIA